MLQSDSPTPLLDGDAKRTHVFGIGWAVSGASISGKDTRHVATTVCYRQGLNDTTNAVRCFDHRFVLDMRADHSLRSDVDLSGLLGLLSPWRRPDDKDAHADLERALSDVLLWTLYRALDATKEEPAVILLQGPLLPKLCGRIYYRMLDVRKIPLFIITSEPRWLATLTAAMRSTSSASGRSASGLEWAGPIPDLALDAPGREFVGWRCGQPAVHIHVPANAVPINEAYVFVRDCLVTLKEMFIRAVACPMHGAAALPEVLSRAIVEAETLKEDLLDDLVGIEEMFDNCTQYKQLKQEVPSSVVPLVRKAIENKHGARPKLAARKLVIPDDIMIDDLRGALADVLTDKKDGTTLKTFVAAMGRTRRSRESGRRSHESA